VHTRFHGHSSWRAQFVRRSTHQLPADFTLHYMTDRPRKTPWAAGSKTISALHKLFPVRIHHSLGDKAIGLPRNSALPRQTASLPRPAATRSWLAARGSGRLHPLEASTRQRLGSGRGRSRNERRRGGTRWCRCRCRCRCRVGHRFGSRRHGSGSNRGTEGSESPVERHGHGRSHHSMARSSRQLHHGSCGEQIARLAEDGLLSLLGRRSRWGGVVRLVSCAMVGR